MNSCFKTTILSLALALSIPAAQAVGNLVDVEIVDRTSGETLPIYTHRGQYWVVGTPGHRYGVMLNNWQSDRKLTVVAVDGINVLNGETASWEQTGYVLDGNQNANITGWRKSTREVAAFVFTGLPRSYAARTGRPKNVGVIGVASFREKPPEPAPPILMRRGRAEDSVRESAASGAPIPSAAPAAKAQSSERLGTGHGHREYSAVTYTEFERAHARPDDVVAIYYDSRDNLVAMGILPADSPARAHPFPNAPGFVPNP